MSRILDLALLLAVGGAGWLLWQGSSGPSGAPGVAHAADGSPDQPAGAALGPPALPSPTGPGAGAALDTAEGAAPGAPATGALALERPDWTQHAAFQVDEPGLLEHPGLALVVAEGAGGTLALARWSRTGPLDGRVEAGTATAVGFALRAPHLEVVGWATRDPERGDLGSVPLSEWVESVAFEVVDATGAAVPDVTWTRAHSSARVGEAAQPLPTDARGHLLLPRHARLELRAEADGVAASVALPSAQRTLVIRANQ